MSKFTLLLTATLIVGLSSAALHAATPGGALPEGSQLNVLLDTIRANRRALIAVNLQLNKEESAAFWPIYDRYDKEIGAVGERIAALVEDYITHFQDLSNEKALQLVQDYLAAESDRLKVRSAYLPEFTKVLPGRTVARFYQIENKMDAVIRYDLASTIPVVEQASGGPAAKK